MKLEYNLSWIGTKDAEAQWKKMHINSIIVLDLILQTGI